MPLGKFLSKYSEKIRGNDVLDIIFKTYKNSVFLKKEEVLKVCMRRWKFCWNNVACLLVEYSVSCCLACCIGPMSSQRLLHKGVRTSTFIGWLRVRFLTYAWSCVGSKMSTHLKTPKSTKLCNHLWSCFQIHTSI